MNKFFKLKKLILQTIFLYIFLLTSSSMGFEKYYRGDSVSNYFSGIISLKNYNYRDSYNIFASNGILFNHESPLRGETFVSRKVTIHVAKKFLGSKEILYLGNIYSKRDWGHAKDYVEVMWKILQHKKPDDFVVATNNTYTVKQLVNEAFKNINIKIRWSGKGINEKGFNNKTNEVLVKINKRYFRPNELNYLRGNYNKAKTLLKWKPKTSFKNLVKEMVEEDIKKLKNGN